MAVHSRPTHRSTHCYDYGRRYGRRYGHRYTGRQVIEDTTATLLPSTLCEYAYSLCGQYTKFYQKCKVIGSPEQDSRVILLSALEGAPDCHYYC